MQVFGNLSEGTACLWLQPAIDQFLQPIGDGAPQEARTDLEGRLYLVELAPALLQVGVIKTIERGDLALDVFGTGPLHSDAPEAVGWVAAGFSTAIR